MELFGCCLMTGGRETIRNNCGEITGEKGLYAQNSGHSLSLEKGSVGNLAGTQVMKGAISRKGLLVSHSGSHIIAFTEYYLKPV